MVCLMNDLATGVQCSGVSSVYRIKFSFLLGRKDKDLLLVSNTERGRGKGGREGLPLPPALADVMVSFGASICAKREVVGLIPSGFLSDGLMWGVGVPLQDVCVYVKGINPEV